MSKKLLFLILAVICLIVGYVFTEHDSSDSMSISKSKKFSNIANSTQILKVVTQNIGVQQLPQPQVNTLNALLNDVDRFFASSVPNLKAEKATLDYIELRLSALYAPTVEQAKSYYTQAYTAMSCIVYFIPDDAPKTSDELIKSISQHILQDQVLKQKQESVDTQLSGSIFVDIPKLDKERVCNAKYH